MQPLDRGSTHPPEYLRLDRAGSVTAIMLNHNCQRRGARDRSDGDRLRPAGGRFKPEGIQEGAERRLDAPLVALIGRITPDPTINPLSILICR